MPAIVRAMANTNDTDTRIEVTTANGSRFRMEGRDRDDRDRDTWTGHGVTHMDKRPTHYIIGSGSHGCMYDNGPHAHSTLDAAVDDLATTFELGRVRRARLKADRYLELGKNFGADYAEISECNCLTPWEHNEDDSADNWPDYEDPSAIVDHYDGDSGAHLVSFPVECGRDCSTPGQPADESVAAWLKDARVVWVADDATLRQSLTSTGAWEDLETVDIDTIKARVLWMAACDWREEQVTR